MNKPFTLEEYKKNPSRLRFRNSSCIPVASTLVFKDDIAIKFADGSATIYGLASHSLLELATEYEVRRARPWRFEYGDSTITLGPPPKYPASPWVFCGPEFEYKVEKP